MKISQCNPFVQLMFFNTKIEKKLLGAGGVAQVALSLNPSTAGGKKERKVNLSEHGDTSL
jgi:hypothetical protein